MVYLISIPSPLKNSEATTESPLKWPPKDTATLQEDAERKS